MILYMAGAVALAGDYDVSLRIEDRRGRVVVQQDRTIADNIPRAVPFLWKREPASALITTHDDKVCFWLVDAAGAPLQILGTGGCSSLGATSEASTQIDAPEGRVVLDIRARAKDSADERGQVVPFTPPPAAR